MIMTLPVEQVVLLDPDGTPVGSMDKTRVHGTDTPLHLAFSCYGFDRDGRMLLTRRSLGKQTWPGVWTNTCCGHPSPGEDLESAIRRRLRSELGVEPTSLRPVLPGFRYRAVAPDGVRSVRERNYQGFCVHNAQALAVAAQFRAKRGAMLATLGQIALDESVRRRASAYLDSFFADIADELAARAGI